MDKSDNVFLPFITSVKRAIFEVTQLDNLKLQSRLIESIKESLILFKHPAKHPAINVLLVGNNPNLNSKILKNLIPDEFYIEPTKLQREIQFNVSRNDVFDARLITFIDEFINPEVRVCQWADITCFIVDYLNDECLENVLVFEKKFFEYNPLAMILIVTVNIGTIADNDTISDLRSKNVKTINCDLNDPISFSDTICKIKNYIETFESLNNSSSIIITRDKFIKHSKNTSLGSSFFDKKVFIDAQTGLRSSSFLLKTKSESQELQNEYLKGLAYKRCKNGIKAWKKVNLRLLNNGTLCFQSIGVSGQESNNIKYIDLRYCSIKSSSKSSKKFKNSLNSSNISSPDACVSPNYKTISAKPQENITAKNFRFKGNKNRLGSFKKKRSTDSKSIEKAAVEHIVITEEDSCTTTNMAFCITNLDGKVYVFEVSSAERCAEWTKAIEAQIISAISAQPEKNNDTITQAKSNFINEDMFFLMNVEGNNVCADCENLNPRWASINLGILICIECCGVHRNFGSKYSKVRSLELDQWPKYLLRYMQSLGNKFSNSFWDPNREGVLKLDKVSATKARILREEIIGRKYIAKDFVKEMSNISSMPSLLNEKIEEGNLQECYRLINYPLRYEICNTVLNLSMETSLHVAIRCKEALIVQLLIWNEASTTLPDTNNVDPGTLIDIICKSENIESSDETFVSEIKEIFK